MGLKAACIGAAQRLEFPKKLGICERLFGAALARRGVAWMPVRTGLRWKLDLRNPTHRWIVYGYYDPAFLKWAERRLTPASVVVDSGANIGQTVLYLAARARQGLVLAVEPGAHAAAWLAECLEANRGKLGPVEIVRAALGAAKGEVFLEDTWGGERFHGGSSSISAERGERVPMIRLSDLLDEKKIASVDLWKLDVEGYELEALEGARKHLEAKRIRALYVELFRQDKPEYFEHGLKIRRFLDSLGYDCYVFKGSRPGPVREAAPSRASDGLFLPR